MVRPEAPAFACDVITTPDCFSALGAADDRNRDVPGRVLECLGAWPFPIRARTLRVVRMNITKSVSVDPGFMRPHPSALFRAPMFDKRSEALS